MVMAVQHEHVSSHASMVHRPCLWTHELLHRSYLSTHRSYPFIRERGRDRQNGKGGEAIPVKGAFSGWQAVVPTECAGKRILVQVDVEAVEIPWPTM